MKKEVVLWYLQNLDQYNQEGEGKDVHQVIDSLLDRYARFLLHKMCVEFNREKCISKFLDLARQSKSDWVFVHKGLSEEIQSKLDRSSFEKLCASLFPSVYVEMAFGSFPEGMSKIETKHVSKKYEGVPNRSNYPLIRNSRYL